MQNLANNNVFAYSTASHSGLNLYGYAEWSQDKNCFVTMMTGFDATQLQEHLTNRGEKNVKVVIMPDKELFAADYNVGELEEIDGQCYHELLNVLPPQQWEMINGVSIFRMSEELAAGIYTFVIQYQNRYFTVNDYKITPYNNHVLKVLKVVHLI